MHEAPSPSFFTIPCLLLNLPYLPLAILLSPGPLERIRRFEPLQGTLNRALRAPDLSGNLL